MNNERVTYLDAAKAWLILLVAVGHILIVLNPGYDKILFTAAQSVIYAFHMPAFFIIHGVLFRSEKWKDAPFLSYLGKRAYSLIIPYLFFELIGILWLAAFRHQGISVGFMKLITFRCNVGADWFLPSMFLGSVLFELYIKHPNRFYGAVSAVVCFVLPMFMSGSQLRIVLGRGMLAYGFIMIGYAGKRLFLSGKTGKPLWLIVSLTVTVLTAYAGLKLGGNDMYSCTVRNPALLVLGGVSGTVFVLGFCRRWPCRMAEKLGSHTLTIMGTHQLLIYAIGALFPWVYGGSILTGLCLLAAITVFELPVVWLIERYLPFCVGNR